MVQAKNLKKYNLGVTDLPNNSKLLPRSLIDADAIHAPNPQPMETYPYNKDKPTPADMERKMSSQLNPKLHLTTAYSIIVPEGREVGYVLIEYSVLNG